MSSAELARALDKDAGLLPMKFSVDRKSLIEQWFWRASPTSSNGLEAIWLSAAQRGTANFAEARVFLANNGPYSGMWRAYVSAPDSLQSINLKDTAVGTFTSHREAMAAANQFVRSHLATVAKNSQPSTRSAVRR